MEDPSTIGTDWIPGTVFLTRTTDTNHSGWLFTVTFLCLLYTLTLLLVTSATRRKWTPSDWAFLAASLCALISHAVVLAGLPQGLGKASDLIDTSTRRSSVQDVCPPCSLYHRPKLTVDSLAALIPASISSVTEAQSCRRHWLSIDSSNPGRWELGSWPGVRWSSRHCRSHCLC